MGVAARGANLPETNQLTQLLSAVKPAPTAFELKLRGARRWCARVMLLRARAAMWCEGEGEGRGRWGAFGKGQSGRS